MVRVLITGGTGFVGTHLASYLQTRGFEVAVLSSAGLRKQNFAADFFEADVRDADAVQRIVRQVSPDAVYHLAGISAIGAANTNPNLTREVNVTGARNVFAASMSLPGPVKILNVSSSQVYAPSSQPLTEENPIAPLGPYASSKAEAEGIARQYAKDSPRGIITARPFNHTGPGQSSDFVLSSIARQFAEIEAGQRPPKLTLGNIHVKRDFSDVRDVVRAYSLLLDRGRFGEVYNVCSGMAPSIAEGIAIFQGLTGLDVSVETDPGRVRANEVPEIRGDPSKISRDTGWTPQIEFARTLEDLLNYWRSKCRVTEAALDTFSA